MTIPAENLPLPPAPAPQPLALPSPLPVPARTHATSEATYSTYYPSPASIEMHHSRRKRVKDWTDGVPHISEHGGPTVYTGGGGTATWSHIGTSVYESRTRAPSLVENGERKDEEENSYLKTHKLPDLRSLEEPIRSEVSRHQKRSCSTPNPPILSNIPDQPSKPPIIPERRRPTPAPSLQNLQIPGQSKIRESSPIPRHDKPHPAVACGPPSIGEPSMPTKIGSALSQREAYLASALTLPLDLITEVLPPPPPEVVKSGKVATMLSRSKSKGPNGVVGESTVPAEEVRGDGQPSRGNTLKKKQESAAVPKPVEEGGLEGEKVNKEATSGQVIQRQKTHRSERAKEERPTSEATVAQAARKPLPPSTGVPIGAVITRSQQGRIVSAPVNLDRPSKPLTETTVQQAAQKTLPAPIEKNSVPPSESILVQAVEKPPLTNPSNKTPTETIVYQAAQKPLPPSTADSSQMKSIPSSETTLVQATKQNLPSTVQSERQPSSETTLVKASRNPLPPTVASSMRSSAGRRTSSSNIMRKPVPSLDSLFPPEQRKQLDELLRPQSPGPETSFSRSASPDISRQPGVPTHRQLLPLPRPAITPAGSVDGGTSLRKRHDGSVTNLQARFEPAMYPLPASERTESSSIVAPPRAPSPLPVVRVSTREPEQPDRSPVSLVPVQFTPSSRPIEQLQTESDHVSFEVPSGSRGRLRVSLAWLPGRNGHSRSSRQSDVGSPRQPPPPPPKPPLETYRKSSREKRDRDSRDGGSQKETPVIKDILDNGYPSSPLFGLNGYYNPYISGMNLPPYVRGPQQVYQLSNPFVYPQPIPHSPLAGINTGGMTGWSGYPAQNGMGRQLPPTSPPRPESVDPPSEDDLSPRMNALPQVHRGSIEGYPNWQAGQQIYGNGARINPYTGRPIGSLPNLNGQTPAYPQMQDQGREGRLWKRFFNNNNRNGRNLPENEETGDSVNAWRRDVPPGRAPTAEVPPTPISKYRPSGYFEGPHAHPLRHEPSLWERYVLRRKIPVDGYYTSRLGGDQATLRRRDGEREREREDRYGGERLETNLYGVAPFTRTGYSRQSRGFERDLSILDEAKRAREIEKERWRRERAARRDRRKARRVEEARRNRDGRGEERYAGDERDGGIGGRGRSATMVGEWVSKVRARIPSDHRRHQNGSRDTVTNPSHLDYRQANIHPSAVGGNRIRSQGKWKDRLTPSASTTPSASRERLIRVSSGTRGGVRDEREDYQGGGNKSRKTAKRFWGSSILPDFLRVGSVEKVRKERLKRR